MLLIYPTEFMRQPEIPSGEARLLFLRRPRKIPTPGGEYSPDECDEPRGAAVERSIARPTTDEQGVVQLPEYRKSDSASGVPVDQQRLVEFLSQSGISFVAIVKWLLTNGPALNHDTVKAEPTLVGLGVNEPGVKRSSSSYPSIDYRPANGIPQRVLLEDYWPRGSDPDYLMNSDVEFEARSAEMQHQFTSAEVYVGPLNGLRDEWHASLERFYQLKQRVCESPENSRERQELNIQLLRFSCELSARRHYTMAWFGRSERYLTDQFRRNYGIKASAEFQLQNQSMVLQFENEYPYARKLLTENAEFLDGMSLEFDDQVQTVIMHIDGDEVLQPTDERWKPLWKRFEKLRAVMSEELNAHQKLDSFEAAFGEMPESFRNQQFRIEHRDDLGKDEEEVGDALRLEREIFGVKKTPQTDASQEAAA